MRLPVLLPPPAPAGRGGPSEARVGGGALVLLLLAACGPTPVDTGTNPGPVLDHTPPTGPFVAGEALVLTGTATDADGVAAVTLLHRTLATDTGAAGAWVTADADLDAAGSQATWQVTVDALAAPGLEYRLQARDGATPSGIAALPEDPAESFVLDVAVQTRALPFSESFEDADTLGALGWWAPTEAFAGAPFDLTDAHAADGDQSAVHLRGSVGVGELRDWLVSPPLDLSDVGEDGVMVHWQERGAGTDAADHALYASTGSPDPADGDYVLVAALPAPPEGAWARATAVDLSALAGASPVYLGWFTAGQDADDWWIDSVSVGPLVGDLVDPVVSWEPDPVGPGEVAALTITLDNPVDADLSGVEAVLSLPEGGGVLAEERVSVGEVPGLGQATATFALTVDAGWPEHSYLPLALSLSDEEGRSWVFDELAMVVGLPSTGVVALSLDADAAVTVDVGTGDPEAPTLTVPVAEEVLTAGSHSLQVDLTDWSAVLPAAAGPDARWHARVTATADGRVDAFTLEHAGTVQAATVLPDLAADLPATVWLPEPPAPEVAEATTEPTLAPGVTAELTLVLDNLGAETAGPVQVEVWTDDPDLVLTGGEARALTDGPWIAHDRKTLDGLTVTVADDHRDSTPVQLTVEVDDGVDAFSLPVDLAVPWPRYAVSRVAVLDLAGDTGEDSGGSGGGDGDGRLDAGELATLALTVANAGGADALGPVVASAALAADSEVTADVDTAAVDLGALAAGETATWELVVQAGDGSPGDALRLELTLDDGSAAWTETLVVPLSELPWQWLTPFEDAAGDVLDAGAVDLRSARYRVVDETLQLEVLGHGDLDAETAFVEIWGRSDASTYLYHRIISQPGGVDLDGYLSGTGWVPLPAPARSQPDARTLRLDLPLDALELATDSIRLGLAAGWCGPDAYYCDHLPDGWGYPYVSFSSGEFIEADW